MSFERWLTPTCEEHLNYISQYGWLFPQVDEWCKSIRDQALSEPRPVTEVSLWDVLDRFDTEQGGEVTSLVAIGTDWGLSWESWKNATNRAKLKILAQLARRQFQPPLKAKVQRRTFSAENDPILRAEITAIYVINTADKIPKVIFHALWYASPEPQPTSKNEGPKLWG